MRKVTVPVDMTSEQKTLLGVLSKRQLIYLLGGGAALYIYVPFFWGIFSPINAIVGFLICILSALPTVLGVLAFAFIYKEKQHMYLDRYLMIKMRSRSERGKWRKGYEPTNWTKENL
ncbi:PrgI family protein [Bacillus sp. AFS098217]|uniref:PrgI family protein n=1 Tax=Bacillus sp. AFS098217 TaxID=2033868 RepID=UPI000BED8F48|nr:PrgI family protein [Bacillus sp. AFS098217]PEB54612.1 PrgI family protein [Bacillus sp. AFS098217]